MALSAVFSDPSSQMQAIKTPNGAQLPAWLRPAACVPGVLAVLISFSSSSRAAEPPVPNLQVFRKDIAPVLKRACVHCHGPKKQKGKFRVDTLNPDLLEGGDVKWWLEVFDVVSNGEMPPEDGEVHLAGTERASVVD